MLCAFPEGGYSHSRVLSAGHEENSPLKKAVSGLAKAQSQGAENRPVSMFKRIGEGRKNTERG